MSYILDALTKSQRQRQHTGVPGLETPQLATPAARERPGSLWNAALLAVTVASVAYGIHAHFYAPEAAPDSTPVTATSGRAPAFTPAAPAANAPSSASRGGQSSSVTSPSIEAANVPAPGNVSRPAREIPPLREASAVQTAPIVSTGHDSGVRSTSNPPVRQSESHANRPQATRAPRTPQALRLPDSPAQEPPAVSRRSPADRSLPVMPEPPRARPSPATERLRQELARLAEEEPARAPLPVPTPGVAPAALPAEAASTTATALPTVNELPSDVRLGLGELKVNAHVYSALRAERLVVINMRRYREGERLTAGPRIDAITPRGAVLSLDSRRFRIDVR